MQMLSSCKVNVDSASKLSQENTSDVSVAYSLQIKICLLPINLCLNCVTGSIIHRDLFSSCLRLQQVDVPVVVVLVSMSRNSASHDSMLPLLIRCHPVKQDCTRSQGEAQLTVRVDTMLFE